MVARLGIGAPFWINAISNLGIIGALFWWRPPKAGTGTCRQNGSVSAIRAGFRHARNNSPLARNIDQGRGFFLFASAYWALLPLVARSQIAGGPVFTASCSEPSGRAQWAVLLHCLG